MIRKLEWVIDYLWTSIKWGHQTVHQYFIIFILANAEPQSLHPTMTTIGLWVTIDYKWIIAKTITIIKCKSQGCLHLNINLRHLNHFSPGIVHSHLSRFFLQATRELGTFPLVWEAVFLEVQIAKFTPHGDIMELALNSLDGNHLFICVSLWLGTVCFNTAFQGFGTEWCPLTISELIDKKRSKCFIILYY